MEGVPSEDQGQPSQDRTLKVVGLCLKPVQVDGGGGGGVGLPELYGEFKARKICPLGVQNHKLYESFQY